MASTNFHCDPLLWETTQIKVFYVILKDMNKTYQEKMEIITRLFSSKTNENITIKKWCSLFFQTEIYSEIQDGHKNLFPVVRGSSDRTFLGNRKRCRTEMKNYNLRCRYFKVWTREWGEEQQSCSDCHTYSAK